MIATGLIYREHEKNHVSSWAVFKEYSVPIIWSKKT